MRNLFIAISLPLALGGMVACSSSDSTLYAFTYMLPDASMEVSLGVRENECIVVARIYTSADTCYDEYVTPTFYRSMEEGRYNAVKALFADDLISAYRKDAAPGACALECGSMSYLGVNEAWLAGICIDRPYSAETGRMHAIMRETANWCAHSRRCGKSSDDAEPCGTPEELGIPSF